MTSWWSGRRRGTQRRSDPCAGRRSVRVVDEGTPRSAPADGVHNYLGREGTPPAELTAAGRAEVAGYGGTVVPGRAVAAHRPSDGGGSSSLSTTARRWQRGGRW